MNLSIEDLEAIKAIVREVVREELSRLGSQHKAPSTDQQHPTGDTNPDEPKHNEQAQEIVARIPRV